MILGTVRHTEQSPGRFPHSTNAAPLIGPFSHVFDNHFIPVAKSVLAAGDCYLLLIRFR